MPPLPPSRTSTPVQPTFPASPLPLAFLSFDAALYLVSDCLTEARLAREGNALWDEAEWYKAAESCALQTGYLELLRLVWGETKHCRSVKRRARRRVARL